MIMDEDDFPAGVDREEWLRTHPPQRSLVTKEFSTDYATPIMDPVTQARWDTWATSLIGKALSENTKDLLEAVGDALAHERRALRKEIDTLVTSQGLHLNSEQIRERLRTLRDKLEER
jgi:hypothetical protein